MADHYTVKLVCIDTSCGALMTFNVRLGYRQTVEQAVIETLERTFGIRFTFKSKDRLESGTMLNYYFEALEVYSEVTEVVE